MKHKMKLKDKPFNSIKYGKKAIELRLYDEKRQLLQVKDLIEFTNVTTSEKILTEVVGLYKYPNFIELYKAFDKVSLGYGENDIASPKDMEEYYSKEEQDKYGVIGIKVKVKNISK